jgi:hypothetical protein
MYFVEQIVKAVQEGPWRYVCGMPAYDGDTHFRFDMSGHNLDELRANYTPGFIKEIDVDGEPVEINALCKLDGKYMTVYIDIF